jgi:hypothetical protein
MKPMLEENTQFIINNLEGYCVRHGYNYLAEHLTEVTGILSQAFSLAYISSRIGLKGST